MYAKHEKDTFPWPLVVYKRVGITQGGYLKRSGNEICNVPSPGLYYLEVTTFRDFLIINGNFTVISVDMAGQC